MHKLEIFLFTVRNTSSSSSIMHTFLHGSRMLRGSFCGITSEVSLTTISKHSQKRWCSVDPLRDKLWIHITSLQLYAFDKECNFLGLMPALFSYIYLSSKATSPFGCSLKGTMLSVSSELSRYPLLYGAGPTFSIACSGVFIVDEDNLNEIKFQTQTTEI